MRTFTITPDANHAGIDRIGGFSIEEDAGSTASIVIRKGSVSGQPVFFINLAANETATLVLDKTMPCEGGAYVEEVSGSITGVLFGT